MQAEKATVVIASTLDHGPDMASARKKILTITAFSPGTTLIFFELFCLVHQFHLICGDMMDLMDTILKAFFKVKYQYFSSLAKIVHSWRFLAEFMTATFPVDHFAFRTLPPQPIHGRFGCVHYLETFLRAVEITSVHGRLHKANVDKSKCKNKSKQSVQEQQDDHSGANTQSDAKATSNKQMFKLV